MSDTKNKVKEIFREYLKENFKQNAENLKIYILSLIHISEPTRH